MASNNLSSSAAPDCLTDQRSEEDLFGFVYSALDEIRRRALAGDRGAMGCLQTIDLIIIELASPRPTWARLLELVGQLNRNVSA